jgi:hypothetical protein
MNPRRDDVAMNERSAIIETAIRPLRSSKGKGLMSNFESLTERIMRSPAEGEDTPLSRARADIYIAVSMFD